VFFAPLFGIAQRRVAWSVETGGLFGQSAQ
jgi:hypothetical protein